MPGVTSVEHGMMMDEEGIELMKEYGTTLVPTLIAAERIVVKGKETVLRLGHCQGQHRILPCHRRIQALQ